MVAINIMSRYNKYQLVMDSDYSVYPEKTIEFKRAHGFYPSDQRRQLMEQITMGFFGKQRYKRMTLIVISSKAFGAFKFVNRLHQAVKGLAFIIEMKPIIVEHCIEDKDDRVKTVEVTQTHFFLTLTRNPTQKDLDHIGYNAPVDAQTITKPINRILWASHPQRGFPQKKHYVESHKNRQETGKNDGQPKTQNESVRHPVRRFDPDEIEHRKPIRDNFSQPNDGPRRNNNNNRDNNNRDQRNNDNNYNNNNNRDNNKPKNNNNQNNNNNNNNSQNNNNNNNNIERHNYELKHIKTYNEEGNNINNNNSRMDSRGERAPPGLKRGKYDN